ncbi:ATP-grasp domain-containing protein [Pollutimonas harenae]|uniref:Alpha-L-glutamate ligase n=1 Tax=Pollutimonas harenae TaxID=657015 RepID=A0A853GWH7_9BURK|nr:alpha-L-glutamate ligase [Pollutimonas harenae]NYT86497.1 alpha-L-glutamate ligase [Pollutimonas harenae]TEA69758.1 alpha-L-glutamate ligase [Pollutimonas harenae]
MSKIYVIHENSTWVEPLQAAFRELNLPYEEWFLDEGKLDLSEPPPEGVFYNRMSASSHTRDHRYAPEYTAAVLSWLESHGRRVVNNSRALQLEVSKVAQYAALSNYGVRTPRTIAAVGKPHIIEAARKMTGSFITKHNRAGKGLGVQLFHSVEALQDYVNSDQFEPSIDGITLIQQYIRAPQPYITRVEFVGGKFLYAVRVDTSLGFELCPADVCQIGDAFCPVGESAPAAAAPRFEIIKGFDSPIIQRYQRFIAENGIGIAGIEFIVDEIGEIYTYDVNTNTNYNSDAEAVAGLYGMRAIAQYLGQQLQDVNTTLRNAQPVPAVA